MKSLGLALLALLLTTAILAPAVITLTNLDEKGIVIDFNEEEKKEEKKEAKEKDYFLDSNFAVLDFLEIEKVSISRFHMERDYHTSLSIFLLPPKHNL